MMLRALSLVLLLLIAAPLASAEEREVVADAKPAFWTVERDGKTLYLFGSVHLLPPHTKWRREEIDKARATAQVFVFEAPVEDGGKAMIQFVQESGKLPAGQTLKDVLPAQLNEDMEKAAWGLHYPPKQLQQLRPWLAAVYLELYAYIGAGFSSYYGVDHVIEEDAKARGAEFFYFESVSEQLSYFAKLDRRTEIGYLRSTVHGVLEEPDLPLVLVNAWAEGRTEDLAKLMDEGFKETPELKQRLIVARNRRWLPVIRRMIASEKTHFVTVGAGHLVGRDGLVAMLRAKGYKVTGP